MGKLRHWWRVLWGRGSAGSVPAGPDAVRPVPRADPDADEPTRVAPVRRRYTAAPVADDPHREAHLGAVLQALAAGPLRRAELGRRVDTGAWGPGRLDAVVDHGIATHVLVETDDGAVRSRYAD